MLRKAKISAKLNMERATIQERKTLMEGGQEGIRLRQSKTRQDIVRASKEHTETLKRIRARMHSETEKTSDTLNELNRSSKVIEEIIHEHSAIGGTITHGKGVLGKLKRRDFTDKLLIMFGFFFFALVVFYIIKTRLNLKFFWITSIKISISILLYGYYFLYKNVESNSN